MKLLANLTQHFIAPAIFLLSLSGHSAQAPLTIAVIDTGADIRHSSIASKLWINQSEIPNNGIDDDGNGYIDDLHGWNFAHNNNDVSDKHSHGTHIAGIISKNANQSKHRLMILKYFSMGQTAQEQTRSLINSLKYAIDNGANIINVSAGGNSFSDEEFKLLQKARNKGILVIAASGNKKASWQNKNFYPSAYNLPNVVSVSATDENGYLLPTTNSNLSKASVFFKGENILGPVPNNKMESKTGSSQAAAGFTGYILRYIEDKTKVLSAIQNYLKSHDKIVAINTNN